MWASARGRKARAPGFGARARALPPFARKKRRMGHPLRAEPSGDCGLAVIATMVAAAMISGESVFIVRVMIAGACMASPIARLVAVEVVERLFAAIRRRSSVAMAGIIAVVDMAVEVAGAAEPVPGADEHAVIEPIGPVVAVGRAVIGSVVVVAVGTDRLDTEVDGDLGWRYARRAKQCSCENCECEGANFGHDLS